MWKVYVLTFAIAFWIGLTGKVFAHEFTVTIERWIDADTFDGDLDLGIGVLLPDQRFRLMCINAPESRGKDKSDEGVAMTKAVRDMGIVAGTVQLVERDAFGRWLAWFTPAEWEATMNRWLFENGAPLYDGLTRAERAECVERLS